MRRSANNVFAYFEAIDIKVKYRTPGQFIYTVVDIAALNAIGQLAKQPVSDAALKTRSGYSRSCNGGDRVIQIKLTENVISKHLSKFEVFL